MGNRLEQGDVAGRAATRIRSATEPVTDGANDEGKSDAQVALVPLERASGTQNPEGSAQYLWKGRPRTSAAPANVGGPSTFGTGLGAAKPQEGAQVPLERANSNKRCGAGSKGTGVPDVGRTLEQGNATRRAATRARSVTKPVTNDTGESFVGRGHRVERERSEQAKARGREARGAIPAVRGRNAGQGTSAGGQHRAGTARSGAAEAGAAGRSRGGSQAAARGRDARGAVPASRGRDAGQVTRAGGQLRAGTTRSRPAEARNAAGSRGRGRSGGA